MSAKLIIQFEGWSIIRQPTDPDPTDEARGVSGYTFALAGEPDLNRVIYLQTPQEFEPRTHGPDLGVTVRRAARHDAQGQTEIKALEKGTVHLLGEPKLENRNWTLTPAGFEPIVPFDLEIQGQGISIRRSAPIDPDHPDRPIWQIEEAMLRAKAADGVVYEPATIGNATGIWDSLQIATERCALLEKDLAALRQKRHKSEQDLIAIAVLEARISELKIGIGNPQDRRIMARYYVERFAFQMQGQAVITGDEEGLLCGKLNTAETPGWTIGFWFGAWDPDTLTSYMKGALEIPYVE
ncbi:MAG: hypothetical protein R3293_15815 [Candidatus Promineifilaceae bacterium]|nr:hypothetical protein [Candidatus Promineifilaceae bacterium]